MRGSDFDEGAFFRALAEAGPRAVLIGRRALIALGLPVLTADYDFWIHADDIEPFNAVASRFELHPNHEPGEARARGRYILENDEHVDVLVARARSTVDGRTLTFEELWTRRRVLPLGDSAEICVPSIDDLILTKLFAARARDLDDIQLLEALREEQQR